MYTRGSITVYFTLLLSVMISLISTLLLSAKVAAGRVQIGLAVDQTLFSAMAKYDRELFEEYHLFYIDGGFGTNTLQLGKALDEMESDLSYLLVPNKGREWTGGKNFLQLEKAGSSITGYTLATDCNGSVFMEQVISYMEDTLGIQGISLLTQKLTEQKELIESQERAREENEQKGTLQDYEDIKTEVLEGKKGEEESHLTNGTEDTAEKEEITEETKKIAEQTQDVLDAVTTLHNMSILKLVLPDVQSVSGWSSDWETRLTNRELQTGMGYLERTQKDSLIKDVLFQEYMLQNLNCYGNELRFLGPSYGVENVLFGKASDMENLGEMAERLLWVREGANVASLCLDQGKMDQVQMMAEALAAVFSAPYLATVLAGAIVIAWAYVESVVDVRALFLGEEVPPIKDDQTWQVSFAEIPGALIKPDQYYQDAQGMSYKDYLRVFLLTVPEEKKIHRCMEVIEQSIRELPGKEQFSMDCAIDTLEATFQIRSQDIITFDITRKQSYRTL